MFELWCWRRLLRVPWTARRSNQSILKEINPGIFLDRSTCCFPDTKRTQRTERTQCGNCEFGKTDVPLVPSYNTPVGRRQSFPFFSRSGPSRLRKLSVEDSYLLGDRDCHRFLRGPEGLSEKRGDARLETRLPSLGQEGLLEKDMATRSRTRP